MEKVRRMNSKFAMCPRRRRRLLREEALAAWRFQPSDADAARIFEASQRDMEILTGALVTVLNSRPSEGAIMGTSNDKNVGPCTSEAALSSSSAGCYPASSLSEEDAVEAETMASMEVSDSMDSMAAQYEAPGNPTPSAEALSRSRNNQSSIPAMNNNSKAAPCLLKPQPKLPDGIASNMIPSDSSSWGLPVGINGVFETFSHYLHPATFRDSLAENSVYSVDNATSGSDFDSMGIDKANTLSLSVKGISGTS